MSKADDRNMSQPQPNQKLKKNQPKATNGSLMQQEDPSP